MDDADAKYRWTHVAGRMLNRPLLIHPQKAEVIVAALAERLGISQFTRINGDVFVLGPQAFDQEQENESRPVRSYETNGYDVEMGVARIDIEGTLVHKWGSLRPYSGMMGYDGIRENFVMAMNDPDVRAIWLDIDSPGGEVNGCFDLVDTMYAARGRKPVWAMLNESAFSAAYAIASAADRVTVPRTGGTGSIGVIWMHADLSEAIKGCGIKVTVFTHGARKADGWPEVPLSEEARKRFQSEIDYLGGLFDETVARNRGLPVSKIRDMEAATFLGAEGVSLGLADQVMAPDAAFRALLKELG